MNKKWNWNNPITWKQSILGSVICLVIYAIGVLIWLAYEKAWLDAIRMSAIKGCQNVRTKFKRKG